MDVPLPAVRCRNTAGPYDGVIKAEPTPIGNDGVNHAAASPTWCFSSPSMSCQVSPSYTIYAGAYVVVLFLVDLARGGEDIVGEISKSRSEPGCRLIAGQYRS